MFRHFTESLRLREIWSRCVGEILGADDDEDQIIDEIRFRCQTISDRFLRRAPVPRPIEQRSGCMVLRQMASMRLPRSRGAATGQKSGEL